MRKLSLALAAVGLGALPSPARALPLNPLDWTAEPFLILYALLSAAALFGALWLRERQRLGGPAAHAGPLSVVELAYLAGGTERACDAVVLGLVEAGAAGYGSRAGTVTVEDRDTPLPAHLEPFRDAVKDGLHRSALLVALRPRIDAVRARLVRAGLAPSDDRLRDMRVATLGLVLPVLGLGIAKMIVGSGRDKPIGILMALAIVTAVLGLAILLHRPTRTAAGDAALDRYRQRYERVARAPRSVGDEMLIAFALGGAIALTGTPHEAYGRATTSWSGGGDGGCGSSGGDGGGGGGCGGCGGGGD